MIEVILALTGGLVFGYFITLKPHQKRLLEQSYTTVIFLLLLSMGIAIGLNQTLLSNGSTLGFYALLFALVTILGSIVCCMILEKTKVIQL
ncbi:MAG: LysO family transporter [Nanoarchaeota archaeon]